VNDFDRTDKLSGCGFAAVAMLLGLFWIAVFR
jgi:hypothetical protein